MDSTVLVCPQEILQSIYLDLVEGDPTSRGYMIKGLDVDSSVKLGDKVSVTLDFPTSLIPSGWIGLQVSDESKQGSEALRSVLATIGQILRSEYNIFHSDYSWAVICEEIARYHARVEPLEEFRKAYMDIDSAVEDCYNAFNWCNQSLSVWLNSINMATNDSTTEAVRTFHQWLSSYATSMAESKYAASSLVANIMVGDAAPGSIFLPSTKKTCGHLGSQIYRVAKRMRVDWEVSYNTLYLLFDKCLKKMHAKASVVDIIELQQQRYQACIHVSFEPRQFIGEPADNSTAAKAKLIYIVLKHIEGNLGFDIIDVNHAVRKHMNTYIESSNASNDTMGMRLQNGSAGKVLSG